MSLKIVHISDTHGLHADLVIPECDVLVHTGDFGMWRATIAELTIFLTWLEKQPAKVKIFISGNHDIVMDTAHTYKRDDAVSKMLAYQYNQEAMRLVSNFNIKYLMNTEYVYEGVKFWGSPYSPTFGNDWAFNADRGEQISKIWAKIPSDVNVLLTHTPVYGMLDAITEEYRHDQGEDLHRGCKDLFDVIKKRLFSLKLHCGGHIHDTVGVILGHVSNSRRVLFSNGAMINNKGLQLVKNPLIITI